MLKDELGGTGSKPKNINKKQIAQQKQNANSDITSILGKILHSKFTWILTINQI